MNVYFLGGSIGILLLVVIAVALVVREARRAQQRKVLRQLLEIYQQAGIALVRYVMLNRQCSEGVAYRRIATFAEKHSQLKDWMFIQNMLAHDRQSLLDRAQLILARDPNAIDKI